MPYVGSFTLLNVSYCFIFLLLRYVIFFILGKNNLIIDCSIQIKDISLYQQLKTTTL